MNFHYISDPADINFTRLVNQSLENHSIVSPLLIKKVSECPFEIYFVASNQSIVPRNENASPRSDFLSDLHTAWAIVNVRNQDLSAFNKALDLIDYHGQQVSIRPVYLSFHLRRFTDDKPGNNFYLLLQEDTVENILPQALRALCNLWQVELQYIPLHSCGIYHGGYLYLFGGPSGAGKSTIARLSHEIGDEVLDEDQLMIYRRHDGTYAANAWGYGLRKGTIPIRAFFNLVKANEMKLSRLSQTHTASLIGEQSFAVIGTMLPEEDYIALFRRVAEFSRSIPGYELHFQKNSDFWKLIEAEFLNG